MGFKFHDEKIKCPFFFGVVKTTNGKVIAVQCRDFSENLGFDIRPMIRFRNTRELRDYLEIFCEDCYETCPYYKTCKEKEA